jgi:hypothetical protein
MADRDDPRTHEATDDDEEPVQMEHPADDDSPARNESLGSVSGAPEASGWAGPSGGMGASGAMGGAGAGGPIGATDPTPQSGDDATKGADPGAVKTEYEMGNEVDPILEPLAESGPRGESERDAHRSVLEDDGPAEGAE